MQRIKIMVVAGIGTVAAAVAGAATNEAPMFDPGSDTNIAAYMAVVDAMPGLTFEKLVAQLMTKQGYRVSNMRASNDYGVDLIASRMKAETGNLKRESTTQGNEGQGEQKDPKSAKESENATAEDAKQEERIAVQVKRSKNKIARKAISDAVGGMLYYKCNGAMVVTNNEFTDDAREFARGTKCVLVDRSVLTEWILRR